MPAYDFRCQNCQTEFTKLYKTIATYEAATPRCPNCQSDDLARVIKKVQVAAPTRDFTKMSSNEMLGVLESGNSQQVGKMFEQIGGSSPELGAQYHETTQRLLKGESMESVEKGLQSKQAESKPADSK